MTTTTLCYIENDDKYLMLHRIKKQNDMNGGKSGGMSYARGEGGNRINTYIL